MLCGKVICEESIVIGIVVARQGWGAWIFKLSMSCTDANYCILSLLTGIAYCTAFLPLLLFLFLKALPYCWEVEVHVKGHF